MELVRVVVAVVAVVTAVVTADTNNLVNYYLT
jgi:hypothetical protein